MYPAPFAPPAGAPVYGPAPTRAPAARAAAPAQAPRRAAPLAQAAAPPPRPVVRAAPPDEPAPRAAPLVMPSPERLGVGVPRPAAGTTLDVARVSQQLQQVGASGYLLDRLPGGGFCFTCWVPGAHPGVSRRFEATADTEAEAARAALERAAKER
jgi:pilus assembly protein FimV